MLVADRQGLFAQALARRLSREPGFELLDIRPSSGVAAVHAAATWRPSIALLDFWLEGIAGPGAVHTIKSVSPATRTLVLGWFHIPLHVRQAFDAGAHGFVSKGLSTAEMMEAVRRVAAGECVVGDGDQGVVEMTGGAAAEGHSSEGRSSLTLRELEVLLLLGAGSPVEDVASRLSITRETARTHLTRILRKTGAHSQLQAVAIARFRGFLP